MSSLTWNRCHDDVSWRISRSGFGSTSDPQNQLHGSCRSWIPRRLFLSTAGSSSQSFVWQVRISFTRGEMLFQRNTQILLSPSTALLLLPPPSKSSAGTAVNSSHSCPLASSALSVNIRRLIGQTIWQLQPPLARNKFKSGLENNYEPPTFKLSDPQAKVRFWRQLTGREFRF